MDDAPKRQPTPRRTSTLFSRATLLRSALALTMLGAAAHHEPAQAQIDDFDPYTFPETDGFADLDRIALRYGDPTDVGTDLRRYRERQWQAQRDEEARLEAAWRAEELERRTAAREDRVARGALRDMRRAQRDFQRALALGDRSVIAYKRGQLRHARRAYRRAVRRAL